MINPLLVSLRLLFAQGAIRCGTWRVTGKPVGSVPLNALIVVNSRVVGGLLAYRRCRLTSCQLPPFSSGDSALGAAKQAAHGTNDKADHDDNHDQECERDHGGHNRMRGGKPGEADGDDVLADA